MTEYPKKLIEVALPLDDINAAAAREKSIRHGHPSTLHLWWARRPLAAARAVLFAQLVNDPGGKRGYGKYKGQTKAGVFDDVLKRLVEKLHYLYSSKERYWFDTQTNLRREAEERKNRFSYASDLAPEITRRLKSMIKGGSFAGVHVFTGHADIPDDSSLRLVILPPKESHIWKQQATKATQAAEIIMRNRGQKPRLNQNRLIFLCADQDTTSTVYEQTRSYLAWKSIIDDKVVLNLDQHRLKEAQHNLQEYDSRLNGALRETYKWALAPCQKEDKKGGVGKLEWESEKISSIGNDIVANIEHALIEDEVIYNKWSPFHLKEVLRKWYFKDGRRDCGLLNLWNDFCRYPYLPRLVDSSVLQTTVITGIQGSDYFGYAAGIEDGCYTGLIFGKDGSVFLDKNSVIVSLEAANAQLEQEKHKSAATENEDDSSAGVDIYTGDRGRIGDKGPSNVGETIPTETTEPKKKKRFFGSVKLQPVSAALDFADIAQEVIQHFSSQLGTEVSITLEIEAENHQGFPETLCRTVSENSKVLGFKNAEFEEE